MARMTDNAAVAAVTRAIARTDAMGHADMIDFVRAALRVLNMSQDLPRDEALADTLWEDAGEKYGSDFKMARFLVNRLRRVDFTTPEGRRAAVEGVFSSYWGELYVDVDQTEWLWNTTFCSVEASYGDHDLNEETARRVAYQIALSAYGLDSLKEVQ